MVGDSAHRGEFGRSGPGQGRVSPAATPLYRHHGLGARKAWSHFNASLHSGVFFWSHDTDWKNATAHTAALGVQAARRIDGTSPPRYSRVFAVILLGGPMHQGGAYHDFTNPRSLSENYGWSKIDLSECPRMNDRPSGRGFATPKNVNFDISRTAS